MKTPNRNLRSTHRRPRLGHANVQSPANGCGGWTRPIARSRNVHGKSAHSNRRERLYVRRRNLHARIVNVRNDNHHKATTAIAKTSDRVVVETLNVSGMLRNRKLARAIADAGMSGFLTKLEYKCAWYGVEFAKVDRWFASSKLCAHCG